MVRFNRGTIRKPADKQERWEYVLTAALVGEGRLRKNQDKTSLDLLPANESDRADNLSLYDVLGWMSTGARLFY